MVLEAAGARRPARVLMVQDDLRAATVVVEMLRAVWPGGLLVTQTRHVSDAVTELTEHGATCVLLELAPGDEAPLSPLQELTAAAPSVPVIVISDVGDEELGVAAVTAGAQDYLVRSELHSALLARSVRYAVQRKRTEVRLSEQALQDPLTELPNRFLFMDRLSVALDRSRRTGLPPAIMFLDVDSFKQVNDSLGHAAGDHLLQVLAERFRELLRPMDTVARIGGDEFTFLFEGLDDAQEALAIAERIRDAAQVPVGLGAPDGDTSVSVSIGIAMADDPSVSLDDAINGADAAMYRAKDLGGARAELFDEGAGPRVVADPVDEPEPDREAPDDEEPAEAEPYEEEPDEGDPDDPRAGAGRGQTGARSGGADALRTAIDARQLRVHYQPRVSINGETGLVGFEALVRWEHPQRGLIWPAEFVPLAEESGLIMPIGDWVIDQALHQVHRWRQSRPGMTISVNLSPGQLRSSVAPVIAEIGLAVMLPQSLYQMS